MTTLFQILTGFLMLVCFVGIFSPLIIGALYVIYCVDLYRTKHATKLTNAVCYVGTILYGLMILTLVGIACYELGGHIL